MKPKLLVFVPRRRMRPVEAEAVRQMLRHYTPELLAVFVRVWRHRPQLVAIAQELF